MGSATMSIDTHNRKGAEAAKEHDKRLSEAISNATNVNSSKRNSAIRLLAEALSGKNGYTTSDRNRINGFLEDQIADGNSELVREIRAERNRILREGSLQ